MNIEEARDLFQLFYSQYGLSLGMFLQTVFHLLATPLRVLKAPRQLKKIFRVPITIPLSDGIKVVVEDLYDLQRVLVLSQEVLLRKVYTRFAEPERGWIILDVGAHVGVFTLSVHKAVGQHGRVIAIEPSPENIRKLLMNIAINKCRNVTIIPEAPSNTNGTAKLFLGSEGAKDSLKVIGRDFVEVKVRTLANLINLLGLRRVDLMKVDVEGAELDVLEGSAKALDKIQRIVIASYHYPHESEDIQRFFTKCNGKFKVQQYNVNGERYLYVTQK